MSTSKQESKIKKLRTFYKKLPWYDPEKIFINFFKDEEYSFWLDSNKHPDKRSRFSYMGIPNKRISYNMSKNELTISEQDTITTSTESIFDYLDRVTSAKMGIYKHKFPFDFIGGLIGYFGYEMHAQTGAKQYYTSQFPDAYLFFVDQFFVFDHQEQCMHLVSLANDKHEAEQWFEEIELRIKTHSVIPSPAIGGEESLRNRVEKSKSDGNVSVTVQKDLSTFVKQASSSVRSTSVKMTGTFHFSRSKQQYLKDIQTCQEYLRNGDCYQICLTNQITADIETNWFSLYKTLRKVNPSPYGAYINFGEFAILSSSPEQFLTIDKKRIITAKPMKGTIRRGQTIKEDKQLKASLGKNKKDVAENAMIVDLLRNDLGKVCHFGSVQVKKFLSVETYATVHQLVSTVIGKLRDDISVIGAIKSAFPGGSMTGAPKLRAMEIIAEIEKQPRSIYSGALGFLSINGTVSLSMIIRTIIATKNQFSFGTGGAILIDSDPEKEYEEMLLKAKALMQAIQEII